eukprot:GEMP01029195.1.p1 GENE.GEMP01029195.1~~GEMP01029195.1.p1  ORF type:complete len:401 (+),score=91.15 GEMP01029195.1:210-1412(+)
MSHGVVNSTVERAFARTDSHWIIERRFPRLALGPEASNGELLPFELIESGHSEDLPLHVESIDATLYEPSWRDPFIRRPRRRLRIVDVPQEAAKLHGTLLFCEDVLAQFEEPPLTLDEVAIDDQVQEVGAAIRARTTVEKRICVRRLPPVELPVAAMALHHSFMSSSKVTALFDRECWPADKPVPYLDILHITPSDDEEGIDDLLARVEAEEKMRAEKEMERKAEEERERKLEAWHVKRKLQIAKEKSRVLNRNKSVCFSRAEASQAKIGASKLVRSSSVALTKKLAGMEFPPKEVRRRATDCAELRAAVAPDGESRGKAASLSGMTNLSQPEKRGKVARRKQSIVAAPVDERCGELAEDECLIVATPDGASEFHASAKRKLASKRRSTAKSIVDTGTPI